MFFEVSVKCQDLAICWEFKIEDDMVPAHKEACAIEGRQKSVSVCAPRNAESELTCCPGATEKGQPNQTGGRGGGFPGGSDS